MVAFFLTVGLHLPGLVDAWSPEPDSVEYVTDPVVFWLVKFMDLALVIPVLLVVGVGVLRRRSWAATAKLALAGWVALLGSSVAGMAIAMQVGGDPAATLANTVAFSLFALVGLGLAVLAYQPLFSNRSPNELGSPQRNRQGRPLGVQGDLDQRVVSASDA